MSRYEIIDFRNGLWGVWANPRTSLDGRYVAVCTTREAAEATLRLLGGGT